MPDELCLCGRYAFKVHCPQCGCATVLGLASRQNYVTRPDGSEATLRVYRCRKCLTVFNDDDWQLRCQAPPPRTRIAPAAERAPISNAPDLTQQAPDDMMRILKSVMKNRGDV